MDDLVNRCDEPGYIGLDSEAGKRFGFTSDKYGGWLWERDGAIYVSFIATRDEGRGDLSALFNAILAAGLTVKVPTPLGKMRNILERKEFTLTHEPTELGDCEVWVKRP